MWVVVIRYAGEVIGCAGVAIRCAGEVIGCVWVAIRYADEVIGYVGVMFCQMFLITNHAR